MLKTTSYVILAAAFALIIMLSAVFMTHQGLYLTDAKVVPDHHLNSYKNAQVQGLGIISG